MIYHCNRTATVVANNYCSLAKVSKPSLEEIISKYPQITQKFKDKIYHYNDNVKLFLEKMIDQISYFRYLSTQAKHEILYKFKKLNLEKGGFLYKINEIATKLYAI